MNLRFPRLLRAKLTCLLLLLGLPAATAVGQNTSTVFSPDVVKGRSMLEYRFTADPDQSVFAHRIHYQYGFTDSFRGRLILQQSGEFWQDLDFRYARLEGLWQFLESEEAGWDSALRFELQVADGDDPPSRFRVAWTGKVDVEAWQFRSNLLTGHEFGEASDPGLLLEGRAQVTRKLGESFRLGADYYGDFNTTRDPGSFNDQEHQLGPIIKFKAGNNWGGFVGALFGVSEAAADTELRILLNTSF